MRIVFPSPLRGKGYADRLSLSPSGEWAGCKARRVRGPLSTDLHLPSPRRGRGHQISLSPCGRGRRAKRAGCGGRPWLEIRPTHHRKTSIFPLDSRATGSYNVLPAVRDRRALVLRPGGGLLPAENDNEKGEEEREEGVQEF